MGARAIVSAENEMADNPSTFSQFQQYVWARLPPRRNAAGQELVADLVALAVQEWPVDVLSQAAPGSDEEREALATVIVSIKRQAEFIYGQKRFASLWFIALQILIPIIVRVILDWWRERKDNRARLILWRRKWHVDGA
jgi:hypothetical protein